MSGPFAGVTLREAVRAATEALQDAGIVDAAGDARRLTAEACRGDGLLLIRAPERTLTEAEASRLSEFVQRRTAHEPVSRILGWREFYGRRFAVTSAVLDPRADTETVVETALDICGREGWRNKPIRILDLGTGSGCILLTLLSELPEATGVGLDISGDALKVAEENAAALGVADRAAFTRGDMRSVELAGFDLVVSNPPYIRSADIAGLDPDVARYDPRVALDGGADGLQFYRDILVQAVSQRSKGAGAQWIVLEAGAGQAAEIAEFAREIGAEAGACQVILRNDLNGISRCVAVKTRS